MGMAFPPHGNGVAQQWNRTAMALYGDGVVW